MQHESIHAVSGHVSLVKRKRGEKWYAKYRLPDGRQVQQLIGPAWSERGRPPEGYFTKRTAKAWLDEILRQARNGTLPGQVRTGTTFASAAEVWLRDGEVERGNKPSTLRDYRSALKCHLLPAFGERSVEELTAKTIRAWRTAAIQSGRLSTRNANKLIAIIHGIYERAREDHPALPNPAAGVKRLHEKYDPARYDFYSPEDVYALVRAAESKQDAAIFLTAAFTGMRMGEVVAVRVSDVDFDAEAIRVLESADGQIAGTPKSGHGRVVPMAPEVAQTLARLLNRPHFTNAEDLVFPGDAGGYLDKSALRRRYKTALARAELRPLRFHDLRHTFGSVVINRASSRQVQEWMGHADGRTTARYLHYKRRPDEAKLIETAFQVTTPEVVASAATH